MRTNDDLWNHLEAAWDRSDRLFECVDRDRLFERPIDLRHPLAFYIGHLPAFASNMLLSALVGAQPHSAQWDRLFAFGIDPDEDVTDGPVQITLPDLDAIYGYRDAVRAQLRDHRAQIESAVGDDIMARDRRMLHLVIEHELMHHETLMYIFQEMRLTRSPQAFLQPASTGAARRQPHVIEVGAGPVVLGATLESRPFVWDNELRAHEVHVDAFRLTDTPVSIAEYREFISAGGYREQKYWNDEAWKWVKKHDLARPKDWSVDGDKTFVRSMFAEHPIDDVSGWPVCVSWAEADAYARFRGGRLPSEAELNRAAYTSPAGKPTEFPWGDHADAEAAGFAVSSSRPVGASTTKDSEWGVAELVENGWEWTSTVFEPYPGFEPYIFCYSGYSADFFDGKHYVVFGGSWATDGRLLRRSFRNWYRFNYPYPFTKFRVAFDA